MAVGGAALFLSLVLAVAALAAQRLPWLPPAALLTALILLWCVQRPSRWAYLLLATILLESSQFSLFIGPARVRPMQILLLPATASIVLMALGGLIRLPRVPLLAPLLLYLAVNALGTATSIAPAQSAKITVLLVSLVLLYVLMYIVMVDDPEAFPSILRFTLSVGFLEIVYGLYQVAAGGANVLFGLGLPIGDKGMLHADYLGTFFGRPYGTLPEPDTYGAVCLFFALFVGLLWMTPSRRVFRNATLCLFFLAAGGGLLLSFVRASWFGLLAGLLLVAALRLFGRIKPVLGVRLAGTLWLAGVLLFAAVLLSANLRDVLARRFNVSGPMAVEQSLSLRNARFQQMAYSFGLFCRRPLLGNGPGTFSVLGTMGAHEEYYLTADRDLSRMYDPSLVTTILNDTGLVGALAFLILVWAYGDHVRRQTRRIADAAWRHAALAGHCALVGLFASFIFTQYFWLPFTWALLAIVLVQFELGARCQVPERGPAAVSRDAALNFSSESP